MGKGGRQREAGGKGRERAKWWNKLVGMGVGGGGGGTEERWGRRDACDL